MRGGEGGERGGKSWWAAAAWRLMACSTRDGELLLVICDEEPPRLPQDPRSVSNVCMTHEVPLPHTRF